MLSSLCFNQLTGRLSHRLCHPLLVQLRAHAVFPMHVFYKTVFIKFQMQFTALVLRALWQTHVQHIIPHFRPKHTFIKMRIAKQMAHLVFVQIGLQTRHIGSFVTLDLLQIACFKSGKFFFGVVFHCLIGCGKSRQNQTRSHTTHHE